MFPLNQKARETLTRLVEAFDDPGSIIDTVAKAALLPPGSPCRRWSLCNRLILSLAGVGDARGYQQWRQVGRNVTPGSKAHYILAPRIKTVTNPDGDDDQVLIGFLGVPVFAAEDTSGAPLPSYKPPTLPKLGSIAQALQIPVKYEGAINPSVLGVYSHSAGDDDGSTGRIVLHSHHEGVLAHEIAHAIAHRCGILRSEDKAADELIAELAAAVLMKIYCGQEMGRQSLEYVRHYSIDKSRVLRLVPAVLAVVDLALTTTEQAQVA